MAESTRIRGMNVERTVEQILNAMEYDNKEIYRETENSDSNFSDKDYQIKTPPFFGSHFSDTEAVIPCLTDSESESDDEDEDSFIALSTTSWIHLQHLGRHAKRAGQLAKAIFAR